MNPKNDTMAVSEFKAKCLAVLQRVKRTGQPVLITRFGKPVAQVVPPPTPELEDGWIGAMSASGRIAGDIVQPVLAEDEWEVLG